jgi:hypothetical protein
LLGKDFTGEARHENPPIRLDHPPPRRFRTGKLIDEAMSSSFQPIDQVPYAIEFPDVQDWDDPPTCILWPEFRSTLQYVRSQGSLPPLHNSHDHLNKQIEVDVDSAVEARWREAFEKLTADKAGEGVELVWFIVDGFVLYWDEVRDSVRCLEGRLTALVGGCRRP